MINTISNFITVYRNQFLVAILISVILIFCSCFSSSTAFGKRNGKSFWRYKYFGYFDKSQFSPFAAGNECADYLLRYYLPDKNKFSQEFFAYINQDSVLKTFDEMKSEILKADFSICMKNVKYHSLKKE